MHTSPIRTSSTHPSPKNASPTHMVFPHSRKLACAILAVALSTALAPAQSFGLSSFGSSKLSSTLKALDLTSTTTKSVNQLAVAGQGERSYIAYVPDNYNSGIAYPVVFGYSGWQHSAEKGASYMRIQETTGADAIVVYPQPRVNSQGLYGWEGPSYAPTTRGEDVDFSRQILEDVASRYNVDRTRVYATGLSNGGGMALADACQAPDLFAAVAGVATAAYTPVVTGCSGQVPTLLIHGTDDPVMNYHQDGVGNGGQYYSARSAWARVGRNNGCDTAGSNVKRSAGYGYEAFTYQGCTDTKLFKVTGGGHTWFPSSPNATQEVWSFFQQHSS